MRQTDGVYRSHQTNWRRVWEDDTEESSGVETHICIASELTRDVLQIFLKLERAVGRQAGELRFGARLEWLLRLTERVPACSALLG